MKREQVSFLLETIGLVYGAFMNYDDFDIDFVLKSINSIKDKNFVKYIRLVSYARLESDGLD